MIKNAAQADTTRQTQARRGVHEHAVHAADDEKYVYYPHLSQPIGICKVSMLTQVSKAKEVYVHGIIKKLVESIGGRYKQGPLKTADRILAKAMGDYHGNCRRVVSQKANLTSPGPAPQHRHATSPPKIPPLTAYQLAHNTPTHNQHHYNNSSPPPAPTTQLDVIRASAIFSSIASFHGAVVALMSDVSEVTVLRVKDRVTKPLTSGYRDVLLNVCVKGCNLVAELQLHFEDVIAIKVLLPMLRPCQFVICMTLLFPNTSNYPK